MSNEKMMILKMLEEGKITAEEASRLMDAAGTGKTEPKNQYKSENRSNEPAGNTNSGSYNNSTYSNQSSQSQNNYGGQSGHYSGSYGGGNNRNYSGQSFDDFANELGRKFDTFAKDMEPKLQKFTESVVEKTASFADSISRSLSQPDSHSGGYYQKPYGTRPAATPHYGSNVLEKNFEMLVTPGYCELNLGGINGDVIVNGYNGDKITAKVNYKPKFHAAQIELMKLGDKYYLNYNEDEFEFVTVDAYVPEKLFKNIRIETVNGKIAISTIITDSLTVNGINVKSEIKNISAENFTMDTSNGETILFNVNGRFAKVETFNGAVNTTAVDVENLSLSASNAQIIMNIDYFNRFNDYTWVVESSNGRLVMNAPTSPELGYFVKAKTSLNNVKLGLTGMNYLVNNPNFIEAKSYNFDDAPKKIKISAETSNAPLTIN